MKKDIFENKVFPFTVPEEYFDTLQERIMDRIEVERNTKVQGRVIRMPLYRKFVAAAACILFILASVTLYVTHTGKQPLVAGTETLLDKDFYQWFFASDGIALMAESLDIQMPENFMTGEIAFSEEDEAIIRFLERDNIQVAAILYSLDSESFLSH